MVATLRSTEPIETTKEILFRTAERPLHLRTREELRSAPVSKQSLWSDPKWVFDNPTAGANKSSSSFTWNLSLSDGRNLLDPYHADLLDWLKRLVWSAYAAPGDKSEALKPGTLSKISSGARYWIVWLVDNYIRWPSEISEDVVRRYINDLRLLAQGDFEADRISENVASARLKPLSMLWSQRFALSKAGIAPMPWPPFGSSGAIAIAKEIGATASGAYKPLPDEVAVLALNTAMEFLGSPAEDVIALVYACESAYNRALANSVVPAGKSILASKAQSVVARNWRFSEVNGSAWHEQLGAREWDKTIIAPIKMKLLVYLNQIRENWDQLDPAIENRVPTLPVTRADHQDIVDLKQISKLIDLHPRQWKILGAHPELRQLISAVAIAQGLPALRRIFAIGEVKRLLISVRSAAQIVIQATTSMRISEICGMQAGIDPVSGLPKSVKVRDSLSGLAEVFVITSNLAKTEETPRSVEWTLGYRPKGSNYLPPAVLAMLVVERLLAPYRVLLETTDLFVSVKTRNGLPKTKSGIGPILATRLLYNARDFVAEWVDLSQLPDSSNRGGLDNDILPYRESHGRCIGSHQWRKTFGHFATSVDRALLPDLQMHFHHVSSAMTDGAYTGNPILERDMSDARYQKMALLALDIAEGRTSVAGRFGEELERKVQIELGPRTENLVPEDAYREAFVYVDEAGLDRLFFEPHGICGARSASQMACHKEAGTADIARWTSRLSPNYETRTPSLCVGCESFAIAKWHLPFWEERYVECAAEILHLEIKGLTSAQFENAHALTRARASQAQAICRKLGSDPDNLQARLQLKVEELNAS